MDDLSGKEIRGSKLIERIGEGGFVVVYRAEQPSIEWRTYLGDLPYEETCRQFP